MSWVRNPKKKKVHMQNKELDLISTINKKIRDKAPKTPQGKNHNVKRSDPLSVDLLGARIANTKRSKRVAVTLPKLSFMDD
jgi:hypothetical protein